MGAIKDTISAVLVDATPEERARLIRLGFRIVVTVHILWACGLLAPIGMTGFVFANEVDDKIESAVTPIYAQLGQITTQLADGAAIQKRILVGQIASQIRELNALRCTTNGHSRERLDEDIEAAQQEYRKLVGERYPLRACGDL